MKKSRDPQAGDRRWWEQWDRAGIASLIDDLWVDGPAGFETLHRQNLARLVKAYYRPAMKTVLEVGCGTGLVYQALVPEVIDNARYTGVDVSEEMLRIARTRFPAGAFRSGDVYSLDYGDASVDAVLAFEVMVHLPAIEKPLREMLRVARRLILFTVWVAPEESLDVEAIQGVEFIHHYFAAPQVLKAIHKQAKGRRHRVEIRPLTDGLWAFAVILGEHRADQLVPFPGFAARFSAGVHQLISKQAKNLDQLADTIERLKADSLPVETVNRDYLPVERVRRDYLPAEQVDREYVPLERVEREYLPIEQVERNYLPLEKVRSGYLPVDRVKREYLPVDQVRRDYVSREQARRMALEAAQAYQDHLSPAQVRARLAILVSELESYRNDRLVAFINRLRPRRDLLPVLDERYTAFQDDSHLFDDVRKYRLTAGPALNDRPYLSYAVQLGREKLTSLRIAPLAGLPPSGGLLGIEIVLPGRGILINQTVEAGPACRAGMAVFVFHPLAESRELLEFRVFARGLDAEVRPVEWQRPAWGFGKIMRKPFFSYIFDE